MTITDATTAPAPVPAEDVSIEPLVDPSVAGAGAADRRRSSLSTFVWTDQDPHFIVDWAQTFTSQKQLTLLPLLVTCAPRHQSKKMEDKAVATATEEVPSDEKKADDEAAKAAEPKEDAPAPPAAGDATAEASDKKEEDDATAGTEEPPKDDAKMVGKDEKTATEAKDDEKAKEVNCCLFYA